MIFAVNDDTIDLRKEIGNTCGDTFNFFQRIINNNYGSCRYLLSSIKSQLINSIGFDENIYLNFDLRKKGIVYYFRIKNTEYVEFCPYPMLTFQSNDNVFVIQTDKNIYKFNILDNKGHREFINNLYNYKNNIRL